MRRKKHTEKLKYLAALLVLTVFGAFFVLHRHMDENVPAVAGKKQIGYKAEDRQKLEQLIHKGAKDD